MRCGLGAGTLSRVLFFAPRRVARRGPRFTACCRGLLRLQFLLHFGEVTLGLRILRLQPRLPFDVFLFVRRRLRAHFLRCALPFSLLFGLAAPLFLFASCCFFFGLPARLLFRYACRLLLGFPARLFLEFSADLVLGARRRLRDSRFHRRAWAGSGIEVNLDLDQIVQ